MPNSPSAAEIETSTLQGVEALKQQIFAYINRLPLGSGATQPVGSTALGAFIGGLSQFAASFEELFRPAAWLNGQGRPQAEGSLNAMLADFRNVVSIYTQMYWDRVRAEGRQWAIANDANGFAISNVQMATANMTAAFARQQTALLDVMEKRCFVCHQIIGLTGGGYHLECARRIWRV